MSFRMITLGLGGLVWAAALVPGLAGAAEPVPIAGKDTCKTAEQHTMPVAGDPAHVLVLQKGTCTVSASGASAMFDGGQLTWTETVDLVAGNGTIRGYLLANYKNGSTAAIGYVGLTTTTMVNGKPSAAFQGTFETTAGTGKLANAVMRGSFKGAPLSDTESVDNWTGILASR